MPVIPRFQTGAVGPSRPAAATGGGRVAMRADTLGAAGQAVARAGYEAGASAMRAGEQLQRIALGLADRAAREQEEADKTETLKLLTQTKAELGRSLLDAKQNAPAGAPDFAEGFLASFDERAAKTLDAAPDSQREALEQRLMAYRGDVEINALAFEFQSRQAKKVSDLEQALGLAVNAVRTDPGTYEATLAEFRGTLAGTELPEAAREGLDAAAVEQMTASYVDGLVNANPFAAERRISAGEFDARLSVGDRARLESRAETEADRIRRKHEAEQKAAEARLVSKVDLAVRLMGRGETPPDLETLVQQAEGTELQAPLLNAVEDLSALQAFSRLPPAERRERLADERRALDADVDADTAGELRRLDRFESLAAIDSRLREAAGKDALATAARQGTVNLEPVDFNDSDTIRARVRLADVATEQTGVRALPFTADELDALAEQVGAMNADQRAALAGTLADGLGGQRLAPVLGALGQKGETLRVFAAAGALQSEAPLVSKRILQGADALAADPNFGPTQDKAILRGETDRIAGAALAGVPAAQYQAIVEAATAYYASEQRAAGDSSGTFDADLWEHSLEEVTGGFVEWGGRPTVTPRRAMGQGEFDDLMTGLTDQDLGELPRTTMTGEAITAATIRDEGQLTAIGQGRYRVTVRGYQLLDREGRPFVLDLREVPIRPAAVEERTRRDLETSFPQLQGRDELRRRATGSGEPAP